MTDRVNGITVLLDRDMRTDDVESLVMAIRHLRGVKDVQTIIVDSASTMAAWRERRRILDQLRTTLGTLESDA